MFFLTPVACVVFTGPLCFTFSKTGRRPSEEGHHDPEAVARVLRAVGVRRKYIRDAPDHRRRVK